MKSCLNNMLSDKSGAHDCVVRADAIVICYQMRRIFRFSMKGANKIMKKMLNEIYIVKPHDTIDSIAKKYGVNPLMILLYNNITPKMISKGKVLFIKKSCF